ncbi:MAG: MBL fold metallo-hydrolase [Alphaproteobacteria bacterium]|nr:MBL fold metallo-hydrolase [Alphaproteobacteria bacterium]
MAVTCSPQVIAFFDEQTFTVSYLVREPSGDKAIIIDSVLDFDASSGRTSTESADGILAVVRNESLKVEWILETHAHADHLSAAPYLKKELGASVAIGAYITVVQSEFVRVFNLGSDLSTDGTQFDRLLRDGDVLNVGGLEIQAWHTPGHTPACMTYVVGDAAFVGDTMFMPDYGTARCDFPGGDAAVMYQSIRRILDLPKETRIFVCHDYGPDGRPYAWESTVAAQRSENKHVRDGVPEDSFVRMRMERDATLAMPALILPSVQVNIRAGEFPTPEDNGVSYLKVPLNAL